MTEAAGGRIPDVGKFHGDRKDGRRVLVRLALGRREPEGREIERIE